MALNHRMTKSDGYIFFPICPGSVLGSHTIKIVSTGSFQCAGAAAPFICLYSRLSL